MPRVCTRCVMDDSSDNSIRFDRNGYCNYCTDALQRMPSECFPDERGKVILEATIDRIKADSASKEFDCLVGLSGGIDSSYVVYLGHKYGLRMLAVHMDDGLDTDTARRNILALCEAADVPLVMIEPDREQYKDLILAFLKASLPNLALGQDNLIGSLLYRVAKEHGVRYILSGTNFASECILERGQHSANAADDVHIRAIHRQYGTKPIDKLPLMSLTQRYIYGRYLSGVRTLRPLNYIDYNLKRCLEELREFCGYEYYGGKHHESILTRFMQCYYLPVKYGVDKRKSHFSSLIVSGQMTRQQALNELASNPYTDERTKVADCNFLARYLGLSPGEFESLLALPPRRHSDYRRSRLNDLASFARRFRRWLE